MATQNKFVGLKLYAFFDLKTVDEAPNFLLTSSRASIRSSSRNREKLRKRSGVPVTSLRDTGLLAWTEPERLGRDW
jgi:hypothetical protein